jgi:formaldehyde-activating enzyme involved in methanogenesis
MAADFFIGESLVGDGNEVAHIDLIIGSKTGPAGAAFTQALSNQKDGFSTLLAVVAPNLPAKPARAPRRQSRCSGRRRRRSRARWSIRSRAA